MRVILAALLVAASVHTALAFDGQRRGFVLGVGAGAATTGYSLDYSWSDGRGGTVDDTEFGVGINALRVGYGFNERVMLYYGGFGTATENLSAGISGLGMTWYLDDDAPAVLLTFTAGLAYTDPEDVGSHLGFGVAGGAGWEFAKHWSVEALAGWAHTSGDEVDAYGFHFFNEPRPDVDTDWWMLLVTVNALAY